MLIFILYYANDILMIRSLVSILLLTELVFCSSATLAQNAPITWIGSANPCNATTLSFPVIDTNFNSITSISLRLDYNPQALVYDTFSAVNPVLTGLLVNNAFVADTLRKLMIVWSDVNPKTIPSGQPLLTLKFLYQGGATNLYWNNAANGGADCEYGDAVGNPLNDLPSETYFKSGYVQGGIVGNAGLITGDPVVCSGSVNAIYQVAPIANATNYIWTIPQGAVITYGSGTNVIHVDFSQGASSGNFQVYGIAGNCQGSPSPNLFVDLIAEPAAPVISLQGLCLLSSELFGNQWYDQNGPISNATSQTYCPVQNGNYYDVVIVDGCPSPPSNIIYYTLAGVYEANEQVAVISNVSGKDFFMIDINMPLEGLLNIKAINMQGETQFTQSCSLPHAGHHTLEIATGNLSHGMYVIELNITTAESQILIRKKIIKQ